MVLPTLAGTISVAAADLSRPERGQSSFPGLVVSRGLGRDSARVPLRRLPRGVWAAQPRRWMPYSSPQARQFLAQSSQHGGYQERRGWQPRRAGADPWIRPWIRPPGRGLHWRLKLAFA